MRPSALGREFDQAIAAGGVVLFPSDTVYGLACDPNNPAAIERLYTLKGRPPAKAAALMFFDLADVLAALPELGPRTRAALSRLLPGPITALVPNPARRFAATAPGDPQTLGLRVVCVPALGTARGPVLQSSANLSGEDAVAELAAVAQSIKDQVDLAIDGGELAGVASTVLDLTDYEATGGWRIVRSGAVSARLIESLLDAAYTFTPETYSDDVSDALHDYIELQAALIDACASIDPRRALELGTGTGETAGRLLAAFPNAMLVGLDGTPAMLAAATRSLDPRRFRGQLGLLQEPLPAGPFDLVASALAVHHLDAGAKADLFARVYEVLTEGGRFVLADLIVPADPAEAVIELEPGFDQPSSLAELAGWLTDAGFRNVALGWRRLDLAVIVAER